MVCHKGCTISLDPGYTLFQRELFYTVTVLIRLKVPLTNLQTQASFVEKSVICGFFHQFNGCPIVKKNLSTELKKMATSTLTNFK